VARVSDLGLRGETTSQLFRPATIGLMIAVGVVAFFGALVLSTYAPDLKGEGHAGAHAASHAAVGFSGLVRLADATGRNPQILRDERAWDSDNLVVATPEDASTPLGKILGARGTRKPTLFVLPKWNVQADNRHKGWIRVRGLLPAFEPEGVFAPALVFGVKRHLDKQPALQVVDDTMPASIRFDTPAKLQVIEPPDKQADDDEDEDAAPVVASPADPQDDDESDDSFEYTYDDIQPLITDGSGGIVLGEIDNLFILADPDLLDNAGMKDERNAASALALLDWLAPPRSQEIGFDVVLNGLGESKSLLRLAFDPPFLAMTLTLAAMVLLLCIRAAGRFGAPRPRARAIAFGKAALVDNSAMLVSKARKARLLGGRYAEAIREQAVRAFAVSPRLVPAEVDRYLDGLGRGARFTDLAQRAEAARDDHEMLAEAQALHTWKREIVRDD
jgi:hypothetical protein